MSFEFAPRGWAKCDGQLLPINQNQALFSLLGTTYGGDGMVSFALPDLRGRLPIHWGDGTILGERGGEEHHTLTLNELPAHTHAVAASSLDANTTGPAGTVLASAANLYGSLVSGLTGVGATAPNGPMVSGPTGGGAGPSHENMMRFLTLNFCIALTGIFPSRN